MPLALTCAMQFEAADGGPDGKPAGLPRFRMTAYTGGPMRVAGWRYPVIVDLAGLAIPSQSRPIRFGHDAASGVGHTDAIGIQAGQLVATGVVSRDTPAAKEVVVSSKNGFPWQASIGAGVEEFEFVKEQQKVLVNGRTFDGPVNVVRKATLGEISFVDLGADGNTSAQVAAIATDHKEIDNMDPNPSTPNPAPAPAPTATVTPAPTALATPAVQATAVEPAVEQIRASALAETTRIAGIRKVCDGRFGEVEAKAIGEGWDVTKTELEILRASRPKAPASPGIIIRSEAAVTGTVLEAACLLSARLNEVEKLYDEPTLDTASRQFKGGIGLQELLLSAAWANGYNGVNFRDSRAVMKFAFQPNLCGGFSTIDIGGILSNVANKFLLEGFFSVERTWRNICAVRSVSDFKTVTSYRLVGKDQYELVKPGGELKHGTLGNESYTNKADTYGLILGVDRRDVINDDLGAITTAPRKLGRGSGLKINDVFWTEFLANSTFFATANTNYIEGADTAFGIDSVTTVEQMLMDQVDSDGKPIGVMPAILLVPTALSAKAAQLQKATEIRDNTSSVKYPIANPHAGKFRPEVSRYLSNKSYTGYSSTAFYLLADPNDLPVIEVAFLNGQESPTIETAEADFNVLGIQMRGYHDFGCTKQDPRGGIKSKGST
jgi:hypothetical protein